MKSKYDDYKLDKQLKDNQVAELKRQKNESKDQATKAADEMKVFKDKVEKLQETLDVKN